MSCERGRVSRHSLLFLLLHLIAWHVLLHHHIHLALLSFSVQLCMRLAWRCFFFMLGLRLCVLCDERLVLAIGLLVIDGLLFFLALSIACSFHLILVLCLFIHPLAACTTQGSATAAHDGG